MTKLLALVSAFAITACVIDQQDTTSTDQQAEEESGQNGPDGKGDRVSELAGTTPAATTNGILYHGGAVMHGNVNAYYIWYGNWTGNSATTILTDLIQSFGGSPYYNINTTYTDGTGAVSNAVTLGGTTTDNYSRGTALSDADIQTIVTAHAGVDLPLDGNGVYFVLTSQDVNATSGFCTNYCGWHTNGSIKGLDLKYSFVGNAARCLSGCAAQTTSPNGNAGADAMASIIAHEFEETTSDPDLNAWYDSVGYENADKCAWTFGTQYTAAGGSKANMHLGSRDYLIQQNWVNAGGGSCVLSYGSVTPDFSVSASPSSQTVVQGASASYTVTVAQSGGFTGAVNLAVSGLPVGASATFGTNPTTSTSTLTVNSGTAATGSYALTITGTSGALTHSTSVTLVVGTVIAPDYSLSLSPSSQSVRRGRAVSYTVNVGRTGGFTGGVALSVSGVPSGATATFNPATVTGSSSTLTIRTTSSTPRATFTLTVTGTSGSITKTTSGNLTVR